ncbi:MAG: 2-oxoacid:ferredoxin oxidoreductase subunit beta [Candidatus Marinimicrobia bacterium]|jgi:2-oxoglutarate ferredoxin oxidoreductase subunit beta|nr:2-oxoacid:ferredoxin oxidoreductase subunit beta [Candidatus Neomarinimicrobiota bacterium]
MTVPTETTLTRKNFISDQDVRWCPGCGDYAILAQVQKVFPDLGVPKENFLIVSGIGCSSRFPYYMDTFGFHSIHGRATPLATGAKLANPDLSVWVVTGDGDSMSIGGNHLIHILRRNLDINILLFNNEVYGLTKGQYSPTSAQGHISKSTPLGSVDYPFNPPQLALGAGGTFIARGIDREQKHLQNLIKEAHRHSGTSFLEIYQNCWVFNDGAFANLTDKEIKMETQLILEHGKPMIFGKGNNKGMRLAGSKLEVVDIGKTSSIDDILVHDESNKIQGLLLSELTHKDGFPTPIGVIYREDKPTYENLMYNQMDKAINLQGEGDLDTLFRSGHTWKVQR